MSLPIKQLLKVFKYFYGIYEENCITSTDSPIAAVIHKSLQSVAHSCMEKVNGTEEDLEYLRKEPPFPQKSACIIVCLLKKVSECTYFYDF